MTTSQSPRVEGFASDLAAIAGIEAIPRILEVVCRTTGMSFAAVARVTEERWIACAVRDAIPLGLQPGGELDISTTICDEVRGSRRLIAIDDVASDEVFCHHPTPKMYGFRSYISVPIHRGRGDFFGTLCALDPNPAQLRTPEVTSMFTLFADLIGFHLDATDQLDASERALSDEREKAELREQFIAVLGHDLRNPLGAITTGTRMLRDLTPDPKALRIVSVIQNSAGRMAGLIDNVMDFARGKLGGGLELTTALVHDLQQTLEHVVAESRVSWPDRAIEKDIAIDRPVAVDAGRVAQLFSNLMTNALTHGDPQTPVRARARSEDTGFVLSVSNGGAPIPPQLIGRLFQPFSRSTARFGQEGLGLGLYIASEIARAHGGTLTVRSSTDETVFTFTIPHRA